MTLPSSILLSAAKQGRGAVALVIVGHRAGAVLLHGQAGLGAVEGLNLALFVNAQDQGLVRRIEIEPDHVLHLGGKVAVARDLESLDQMRFEPVRTPDALDAAVGDPGRRRHAAQAPMGRIRRLLVQRHMHHLFDLSGVSGLTRDGRVASFSNPSTPLATYRRRQRADREQALVYRRRNPLRRQPLARQQHDPRPPNHLLRRVMKQQTARRASLWRPISREGLCPRSSLPCVTPRRALEIEAV
jgi:hypothetical protein